MANEDKSYKKIEDYKNAQKAKDFFKFCLAENEKIKQDYINKTSSEEKNNDNINLHLLYGLSFRIIYQNFIDKKSSEAAYNMFKKIKKQLTDKNIDIGKFIYFYDIKELLNNSVIKLKIHNDNKIFENEIKTYFINFNIMLKLYDEDLFYIDTNSILYNESERKIYVKTKCNIENANMEEYISFRKKYLDDLCYEMFDSDVELVFLVI